MAEQVEADRGGLRFTYLATDRLLVSYQWGELIPDEAWDAYLACIHEHRDLQRALRTCVFTTGVHPTREQFARLRAVSTGFVTRVAIIEPVATQGFAMSVLTLHNRHVRCFPADQRAAAYAYLGLTAAEVAAVESAACCPSEESHS